MKRFSIVPAILALVAMLLPQVSEGGDPEIAYQGGSPGIWVMDADGSNPYQVCGGSKAPYPHWSSDGNSLVYKHDGSVEGHVYRVDLANSPSDCNEVMIARQSGTFAITEETPAHLRWLDGLAYDGLKIPAIWSPGRTEVAVTVDWQDEGNRDVVAVLNPWGPADQSLVPIYSTGEGKGIGGIAWSPDGSQIAVKQGNRDPVPNQLAIVDRSTGVVVPGLVWDAADVEGIENTESAFAALEWARTDAYDYRMAYMSLYKIKPNDSEWFVVVTDFDAHVPQSVAEIITQGRSPSWSPDDTYLAFSKLISKRGEKAVAKINLETREITILGGLTPAMWSWNCPDWKRRDTCGNTTCGPGEDACSCPADCGEPPPAETPGLDCADHQDNDCDTYMDCADTDCPCPVGEICCGGSCTVPLCEDPDCDDGDICTDDACYPCSGCENMFDASNDPSCEVPCVPTSKKEKGPNCNDGLDNDCDGWIDGEDSDC